MIMSNTENKTYRIIDNHRQDRNIVVTATDRNTAMSIGSSKLKTCNIRCIELKENMIMSKTEQNDYVLCRECQNSILQSQADQTGGLCFECAYNALQDKPTEDKPTEDKPKPLKVGDTVKIVKHIESGELKFDDKYLNTTGVILAIDNDRPSPITVSVIDVGIDSFWSDELAICIEPKPKPLHIYLAEYIEHEYIEDGIDATDRDGIELYMGNLPTYIQQGIDAYISIYGEIHITD